MIRIILALFGVIFCYLLQSSVFINLELAGVVPDTMLPLVIACAYFKGRYHGMFVGLLCGLLIDFCMGDIVGICGMLYMFIGYLYGYAEKIYNTEYYTIPIMFILAGEFVYQNMYYFVNFFLRGRLNYSFYFEKIMLPKIIYTTAVGVVLYIVFNQINKLILHFEYGKE